MKKKVIISLIIFIVLVIIILVTALVIKSQNDQKSNMQKTDDVVKSVEGMEDNNDGITRKYMLKKEDDLVYTYLEARVDKMVDDEGRGIYSIPQINIDSDPVKDINEEILKDFEAILASYNDDSKLYETAQSAEYYYSENEDVLSLIIESMTENDNFYTYLVYNVEISTGNRLSNQEFIDKIKYGGESKGSESELRTMIYKKMRAKENDSNKEQIEKSIEIYKNKSLSEFNLYRNNVGLLCIIVNIYKFGDLDPFTISFDLDFDPEVLEMMDNESPKPQESAKPSDDLSIIEVSKEEFVKGLYLNDIREKIKNGEIEEPLDFRIDEVEVYEGKEREDLVKSMGLDESKEFTYATVVFSVKPKDINNTIWHAGNGEIQGDWIVDNARVLTIKNGKIYSAGTGW